MVAVVAECYVKGVSMRIRLLAEQHDERAVGRRSMGAGSLAKLSLAAIIELEDREEVTPSLMVC